MGCSFSGLNALYDSASGGGDVWINENRLRIVRQIGEDGLAFVYLVKEIVSNAPGGSGSGLAAKIGKNQSHVSDDGLYAMKKVAIQSEQQLELVRQEISVSSLFSHPNLLPLLDHAIIPVKDTKDGLTNHEAFLLFPVHLDGTLLDKAKSMQSKTEFFPTITVLQIFHQLCAGLKHMHSFDPPYAHNDVKPGNVLITEKKGNPPVAILMDFGSATPARKQIRSHSEALQLEVQSKAFIVCLFGFRPSFVDATSPAIGAIVRCCYGAVCTRTKVITLASLIQEPCQLSCCCFATYPHPRIAYTSVASSLLSRVLVGGRLKRVQFLGLRKEVKVQISGKKRFYCSTGTIYMPQGFPVQW